MTMQAGEYHIQDGDIILNQGRQVQTISVSNTGDRPIQIGSHYHFYEVNDALSFDERKNSRLSTKYYFWNSGTL